MNNLIGCIKLQENKTPIKIYIAESVSYKNKKKKSITVLCLVAMETKQFLELIIFISQFIKNNI